MSRPIRPANARVSFRDPRPEDYYEDADVEEEEELDAEEKEEERLLSERFGEAGEDVTTSSSSRRGRKRATASAAETDQEIENELAGAAAAAVRKKRRARPTLTVADLLGSHGLIRVKNEFPERVRYRPTVNSRARLSCCRGVGVGNSRERIRKQERNAAAAYGRSLVGAYRSFSRDLFPSLAFEDVLNRIEALGAKKELKSYLQMMRDDVRKRHLEGIYGREKSDTLLHELEHGLSHQAHNELLLPMNSRAAAAAARDNEEYEEQLDEEVDNMPATLESSPPTPNPYGTCKATRNDNISPEKTQADDKGCEESEANLEDEAEFNCAGDTEEDPKGLTENKTSDDSTLDGNERKGDNPDDNREEAQEEGVNERPSKEESEATYVDTGSINGKLAEVAEQDAPRRIGGIETYPASGTPSQSHDIEDADLSTDCLQSPLQERLHEEELIENTSQDKAKSSQSNGASEDAASISDEEKPIPTTTSKLDQTQETVTVVPMMTRVEDEGVMRAEETYTTELEADAEHVECDHANIIIAYSQGEEAEEHLVVDSTQNTEMQTVMPAQDFRGISKFSMDY